MQIYAVHIYVDMFVQKFRGIYFHNHAHLYAECTCIHVCVAASVAQLVRASPRKQWSWV